MRTNIQNIIIYFLLFIIIYNIYIYLFHRPCINGLVEGLENEKKSNSKTRELSLEDDLEKDENMVKIVTKEEEKEEEKKELAKNLNENTDVKQQMKDQLKNEVKIEDMEKRLLKLEEYLNDEKEERDSKDQDEKAMAEAKEQLAKFQ